MAIDTVSKKISISNRIDGKNMKGVERLYYIMFFDD